MRGDRSLHSKESINEKKIRYCCRCENLFQVQSILGNRILGIGEVKQPDLIIYGYYVVTVHPYFKRMK